MRLEPCGTPAVPGAKLVSPHSHPLLPHPMMCLSSCGLACTFHPEGPSIKSFAEAKKKFKK